MKLFRVGTEQQKKNQKFSVPVERWDMLPNFGTGRETKVPKNWPDEEFIGVAINSVTIIGWRIVEFKGVGLKGHHLLAEKLSGLRVIVGLKGVGLKGQLL